MSFCRSCDAKINFVKTLRGKWMPVNPEYVDIHEAEEGDLLITDEGRVITVDFSKDLPNVRGRISHFATCPDANRFRNKTKEPANA